jgi:hypothetical protein
VAAPLALQAAPAALEALREAALGQRVLVDMKFIELLPGTRKKHYQYTAIDDCTRIRVLRICPRSDQKTAIQFADYLLEKLPFHVDVIQTDIQRLLLQGAFHWHILDRGIGHTYIKPATPRLNGKLERSHRIDAEEFYRMLDSVVIATPSYSTPSSKNGSTSTTSSAPTAASMDRPSTNGWDRKTTTPA